MSLERIIQLLEMLKAEVEWDYDLSYQLALDGAIEILKGHMDGHDGSGEN